MSENAIQVKLATSKGDIVLALWDDVAPGHVANFVKLTKDGFYDGLIFHRVIEGFMIQGGCPDGTGMGGPGWNIDAEFNDRPHMKGVLSMARSADPNSAGSQFFICHDDAPHLDGQYTGFGEVVEGLDVVEAIGTVEVDGNDRPSETVTIEKATVVE